MTDLDKMPFGKYKGTVMQDVPASYLLWLWNEGLKDKVGDFDDRGDVADYIKENMDALQMDAPDTIVE